MVRPVNFPALSTRSLTVTLSLSSLYVVGEALHDLESYSTLQSAVLL